MLGIRGQAILTREQVKAVYEVSYYQFFKLPKSYSDENPISMANYMEVIHGILWRQKRRWNSIGRFMKKSGQQNHSIFLESVFHPNYGPEFEDFDSRPMKF